MRTCLGTSGPTFSLRKKNPFLKHNNSSNRSKTKTAIIANSWNYHICEAPRTTASFPSGSKKNSVTQCWRIWSFSHNAEIFQRIYGVDRPTFETVAPGWSVVQTLTLSASSPPLLLSASDCSPLIFSPLWCSALGAGWW